MIVNSPTKFRLVLRHNTRYYHAMSTPRTISFRIDSDKVAALDKIAANMQRDRSFLLNEAVDAYLEWNAEFERLIRQGQEDIRQGRWVEHEEVRRRMESIGKRRKTA